jgi:hypothetical protein
MVQELIEGGQGEFLGGRGRYERHGVPGRLVQRI